MSEALCFIPCEVHDQNGDGTLAPTNWLFPGLGCRYVGMGHDLLERTGGVRKLIHLAEEALGFALAPICLEGSGRKVLPARQEAQVIYVINCAYAMALREEGHHPQVVLGHSLGSWSAAWAAGVFDFLTGLQLVTDVERLLEELLDDRNLCMAAIIGLDEFTIQAELPAGVTIANFNSPAQFVIGGPASDVDQVLSAAIARGAKQAKRLPTSRPVHTPWMEEVARRLRPQLDQVAWSNPTVVFVPCDGSREMRTGAAIRHFFSVFLTRPVRWQQSFRRLKQIGAPRSLEAGPGNLLRNLASFIDPSAVVCGASECLETV